MPTIFPSLGAVWPSFLDLALLLLRLVIGLMFLLSGFFKLTRGKRRKSMEESLQGAGLPNPKGLAPVFSSAELLSGLGLVLGLLTPLSSLFLLVITLGALATTTIPKLEGDSPINKFENLLYSPELLLAVGLIVLIATGAGAYSLDWALFG